MDSLRAEIASTSSCGQTLSMISRQCPTHRYFEGVNWTEILNRAAKAPIVPKNIVRDKTDFFSSDEITSFCSQAYWQTYVEQDDCCLFGGKKKPEVVRNGSHWHDPFDVKKFGLTSTSFKKTPSSFKKTGASFKKSKRAVEMEA